MKGIFHKEIFSLIAILFLVYSITPILTDNALAQGDIPDGDRDIPDGDRDIPDGDRGEHPSIPNPLKGADTIEEVIVRITNYLLAIIGTVCVLVLVFAGFTYVASAGNPEEIERAKSRATYSIIGLFLAIIAWAIVNSIIAIFKQ